MQRKNLGIIDPANMTPEQKWVLGQFLLADAAGLRKTVSTNLLDGSYIGSRDNCVFTCQPENSSQKIEYGFVLKNNLYFCSDPANPNRVEYKVSEKTLSHHPGRIVDLIRGKLIFEANGSLKYKAKEEIVKILYENNSLVIEEHEFKLNRNVQYMKAHQAYGFSVGKKNYQYQFSKFIKGKTVAELENENAQDFSVKQRLVVSIKFLRALAHLHAFQLLHLDVQHQNIISNIDKNAKTTIFDFGNSKYSDDAFRTLTGFHGYRSPEQHKAEVVGPYSDAFGAGRVLANIWKLFLIYDKTTDPKGLGLDKDSDYDRREFDLFDELTAQQKDLIVGTIKQLTVLDASKRLSIYNVIDVFEKVLLEVQLNEKKCSLADELVLKEANRKARYVQNEFLEKATDSKKSPSEKYNFYRNRIRECLFSMNNYPPLAGEEFFRVLDIKSLQNKNAGEVLQLLEDVNASQERDFFKSDLQRVLAEAIALQAKLAQQNPSALKKKTENDLFSLINSLTAEINRDYRLSTFNDFLKTHKRRQRKLDKYQRKMRDIQKQNRDLVMMPIKSNIERLLNLSEKLESISTDLAQNKLDPSFLSLTQNTQALYNEVKQLLQKCDTVSPARTISEFPEDDFFALVKLNREMIGEINQIQDKYENIKRTIQTVLEGGRETLAVNLTLFSGNGLYKADAQKWQIREKATEIVDSLNSPNPEPEKTLTSFVKLQARMQRVVRQPLQCFNDLFAQMDTQPVTGDAELKRLRLLIKGVVGNYIYDSSTSFNLFFKRRAASRTRKEQMDDILDLTNRSWGDHESLKMSLRHYLANMPASSELANQLRQIVKPNADDLELAHVVS